jgi:hypothetical protein
MNRHPSVRWGGVVAMALVITALAGCGTSNNPASDGATTGAPLPASANADANGPAAGGDYCQALIDQGLAAQLLNIAAMPAPHLPPDEGERIAGSIETINGVTKISDLTADDIEVRIRLVALSSQLRDALNNPSNPDLIPMSAGLAVSANLESLTLACERAGVPLS